MIEEKMEDAGREFRVHTAIPFDYIKLELEEYERYKEGFITVSDDDFLSDPLYRKDFAGSTDIDPVLYNCLLDVEQKLNLIIRHLSLQGTGRMVIPREEEVEMSSTGIRFDADRELIRGDVLKVRMVLPTYPISFLTFLSEVNSVVALGNGRYETSITFSALSTDIRDRITSYLFKKQREAIRNEKG